MGTNIFRAVNSTLIYLERGDEYLMLHRTKKENDLNHDKWIGVGGKFEDGDEGELAWIKKSELLKLRLWEGDKIFLRLLDTDEPFFSLKLKYEGDTLVLAQLNGERLEVGK